MKRKGKLLNSKAPFAFEFWVQIPPDGMILKAVSNTKICIILTIDKWLKAFMEEKL